MTKPSAFHQAQDESWKAQIEALKLDLEQRLADFRRCPLIDERGQFIGWCSELDLPPKHQGEES